MSESGGQYAFLGEEFLTWLWYRGEIGQASFVLSDGTEVGVSLDDFLYLGGQPDATEQTLRHGLPTRTAEATVALMAGKRLVRSRLIVACDGEEWELTLDGPRLSFHSVKCVNVDPDEVEEGRDLARMHAFVRIGELVDAVYGVFLKERLDPRFATGTLDEMRGWVRARGLPSAAMV